MIRDVCLVMDLFILVIISISESTVQINITNTCLLFSLLFTFVTICLHVTQLVI
jgi:hypothetical protein